MAFHQFVGVLVVGAKHQFVGIGGHQRYQSLKILGCAAFADENLHTKADFLQGSR